MSSVKKRVLFVCSAGGHLAQILELDPLFKQTDYLIVTEGIEANLSLKDKYNIKFVKPAGKGRDWRFWVNFLSNVFSAIGILAKMRPQVIISTGSHTAVPFCFLGKLFRAKVVFILSFARIKSKAKAATFIHPIANLFLVQWESAMPLYSKAKYLGGGLY